MSDQYNQGEECCIPPYTISVASFKGGVGKTIIALNLAVALQQMGYKTLLIYYKSYNFQVLADKDLKKPKATGSLIDKKLNIEDLFYQHIPTGLHLLDVDQIIKTDKVANPKTLGEKSKPLFDETEYLGKALDSAGYDFVMIDTHPGYHIVQSWHYLSEVLVVSTLNTPALAGAVELAMELDKENIKHRLAINKMSGKAYELSEDEVRAGYDWDIAAKIPLDDSAAMSINVGIPCVVLDKNSEFSSQIIKLSKLYLLWTCKEEIKQ